jgi:hypothetical protein
VLWDEDGPGAANDGGAHAGRPLLRPLPDRLRLSECGCQSGTDLNGRQRNCLDREPRPNAILRLECLRGAGR